MRTTKRRGISGGVLTAFGSTIRTLSRHQQLISLSSMESDLFALQTVAQEMVSLGKVCARMLRSFGETEKEEIPGVLFTDSESALKLLKNLDIPKRSRHLEIRVEWLKGRVILGHLVLEFKTGVGNPSDMLTKCLSSSVFGVHGESLGFEKMAGPIYSLASLGRKMVFVEVCCQEQSSISKACANSGLTTCGVVKEMGRHKTFMGLKTFLDKQKPCRVFVHVSSPLSFFQCISIESRTKEFRGWNFEDGIKESDSWHEMFPWVLKYLRLGDLSRFELPWNNKIWNYDFCRRTLKEAGHTFATQVKLCQTDVKGKNGLPVGKVSFFVRIQRRLLTV